VGFNFGARLVQLVANTLWLESFFSPQYPLISFAVLIIEPALIFSN